MESRLLKECDYINNQTGFLCRYVKSDTEYFAPHRHEYYEIFLMLKGDAIHVVNGIQHTLSPGNLLFIRDFDSHLYIKNNEAPFDFINLTFRKSDLKSLCEYIGDTNIFSSLLKLKLPPVITLTEFERKKVYYSLSELTGSPENPMIKFKFKKLLLDLFFSYFLNYTPATSQIPHWLWNTCEQMKNPQNFIDGITRMYELSGKSREHLSRCMKKYYNTSPTDFILELRLNHSTNLLLSSNLSLIDICYECGFGNVSWFYKMFNRKYGVSPKEYRKLHTLKYNTND